MICEYKSAIMQICHDHRNVFKYFKSYLFCTKIQNMNITYDMAKTEEKYDCKLWFPYLTFNCKFLVFKRHRLTAFEICFHMHGLSINLFNETTILHIKESNLAPEGRERWDDLMVCGAAKPKMNYVSRILVT